MSTRKTFYARNQDGNVLPNPELRSTIGKFVTYHERLLLHESAERILHKMRNTKNVTYLPPVDRVMILRHAISET